MKQFHKQFLYAHLMIVGIKFNLFFYLIIKHLKPWMLLFLQIRHIINRKIQIKFQMHIIKYKMILKITEKRLRYFIKKLQLYFSTKPILIQIIKSGDQYVVDELITFVKYLINKNIDYNNPKQNQNKCIDYVDLLDTIIKTAQIESISIIQNELIFLLMCQIEENKLTQKQIQTIFSWNNYVQQFRSSFNFKGEAYYQVHQFLKSNVKQQRLFSKTEYIKNYQKMKRNNELKINRLIFQNSNMEKITQLIQRLKTKNIKKNKNENQMQQIVSLYSQKHNFDIDTPKSRTNRKIILGSNIQNKTNSQNNFKSYKSASAQPNNNFQLSQYDHNGNNFNEDYIVRQPKMLSGKKKTKRIYSSRDSYDQSSEQFKNKKLNINVDYFQQNLLQEIIKGKQKQKQLQLQLKEKDQLIKKLKYQNSSSESNFMKTSQNQIRKNFSTQLSKQTIPQRSKYPQYSQRSQMKLQTFESITILNKDQNVNKYKAKRDLLKKKVLLIKNVYIQIGLITKLDKKNNILQCQFFCTPFQNLHTFIMRIKCSEWLNSYNKDNLIKNKCSPQIQFVSKFLLSCNVHKHFECYFNKPQLDISFYKENSKQIIKYNIQLPIFINKFSQNIQKNDLNECKKLLSAKRQQFSTLIKLNTKICKGFDDFTKYFPQGVMLENSRTFIAFLTAFKTQFYLYLHIVSKYDGILKILPKNTVRQQNGSQIIILFFKTFCFLFSL